MTPVMGFGQANSTPAAEASEGASPGCEAQAAADGDPICSTSSQIILGLATGATAGVAAGSAEAWNASANNIRLIITSSGLSRDFAAGH